MILLELRDVHKQYHREPILDGVSLRIADDERLALLGRNGAGKSTLLRILAGLEEPDRGRCDRTRDLRVGHLPQVPRLPEDETVRDCVAGAMAERTEILQALERVHEALAKPANDEVLRSLLREQGTLEERLETLGGHDVEHRIDSTLLHLGLRDPDARCGRLSGGEQRRVALARLLLAPPDLWLLDEPTNHLDTDAIEWLEDFLLAARTPFVLVTHDRYFLDRVVRRIVELEHGRLYETEGNYSDYVVAKAAREAQERHAESVRQNLLRRETAWMRRGPPARTTKAKARIQRYEALVDAAPDTPLGELGLELPPGPRLGTKGVELHHVGHGYGERKLFSNVSLELTAGMRLGVVGPNGAGKTTLLEILRGLQIPDHGMVEHGETVRIGAIDQSRTELDEEATVQEAVAGDREVIEFGGRTMRVESFLDRFLFRGERKHARVRDLSGGERQRVLLALLLSTGGNVLVLDEPTNDLDLDTLRALEEALLSFPGALLVVSHDRWFLDRVATHVLWLDGEGGHGLHVGDVSSLLERRRAEREAAESASTKMPAATPNAPSAPNSADSDRRPARRWSSNERNELRELPARIEALESELTDVDQQLSAPELYTGGDPSRAESLAARRHEIQQLLERLYARWEELEAAKPG